MTRRLPLVRLALLALVVTLPPSRARAQDDAERRVDSLFARYTRDDSPGLAVAVVRDGRTVFAKGYGLADLEHRIPITPQTVFDVASVSKQFAGLAIAMLVEDGRLRLDDDLRRLVPPMADIGQRITIDHLVHHTSGLRDWPGTLSVAGWRYDDVISFDQILRFAARQRTLNFVPGAEYTYSNTGYNMLAEVVQRVTGQSFRAWTDAQFFQPLGMTRTVFRDDHTLVVPGRAFGYTRTPEGRWRAVTNNLTALGSSSMMSSAEDMAKWVANFETARVGGAAAMARTRTRGVLNDGTTIPYAYGLRHEAYRGLPAIGHSGSWAGFVSYVIHFPAQRLGVVILANTPQVNAAQAAYQVADVFLGDAAGPRPVAAAATPPAAPAAAPAGADPSLDDYVGDYTSAELEATYHVTRGPDGLVITHWRHGPAPLVRRAGEAFTSGHAFLRTLTFARDAGGAVTGFGVTVDERSRDIRFVRAR